MQTISRRRLGGLAVAATLSAWGAACTPAREDAVPAGALLPQFKHIVVIMFENHSFDAMLGWLYGPGDAPRGQPFEGVAGKHLSNPIPPGADQAGRGSVPAGTTYVMDNPNPDPGEEYSHINTQLFGTVLPESNRLAEALKTQPPYNLPSDPPAAPPMNGFVLDYVNRCQALLGRAPTYDEYSAIMNSFPPDAVPVLSTLARSFAVFDHWHCAVPSQTFCNRSFFHAASSSGRVVNSPYDFWVKHNSAETIFERISALKRPGLDWRIYWDAADGITLTGLIHFPRLAGSFGSNFAHMDQFYRDASSGRLPAYTFIEPRFIFKHNDAHPPFPQLGANPWPSSVLPAEILLNDVYNAIRTSQSRHGNNYQNTLLLITFDEAGGTYDHVPPPAAPAPDTSAPAGEMGFTFTRAGVRVPTIAVSAYTEAGTIINQPFEHTALIKTLSDKWGLGNLNARDRAAPNLAPVINRTTPRTRRSWPVITPRPFDLAAYNNLGARLNDLQAGLAGLGAEIFADTAGIEDGIHTVGDALAITRRAGQRLRL